MQRDRERSSVVTHDAARGTVRRAAPDPAGFAGLAGFAVLAALAAGCVRAPAVVIVDRKTAVEQQASGSFRGLEEELEQAGLAPRPAPLTPAQLGASGVRREGLEAAGQDDVGADALRADALLTKRCVGEALDGTLAPTFDSCTAAVDVPEVGQLIERVNLARRQLWRWLAGKAKGKTDDEVRAAWREVHLQGLVCGGQFQATGGAWEVKQC
jgi:uncharacterized protein YdbL (DUF1318 family)